ncbi:MAG TPA: lipopolysaccharide kinase InaA family protein [Pyrinomonadaceae bacterium]
MNEAQQPEGQGGAGLLATYRALNARWEALCGRYLKVASMDSMWVYSRLSRRLDPEQGWKLQLSATVLTAVEVLEAVAPLLHSRGVLFKAPRSLKELSKINSGIYYGYSQVGKFITVYPQTTEEAARLARELHRRTRGIAAPSVPFNLKFRPDSRLYYRYGSFKALELVNPDGSRTLALRAPDEDLVPDVRDSEKAKPDWVPDLFPARRARRETKVADTPLKTTFRAFRALSQRGKGGVYQAFDVGASPPRFCVLKEGRRNGETAWDGRDGYWRVEHEGRVLASLHDAGVAVPRVYSSFKAEKNFYLAMEFMEGETLDAWLGKRRRRIEVRRALSYGVRLATLISQIHDAGWVWRDCKPSNLMVTQAGVLRPIDFEGACPVDCPDPMPWGTPSYTPPEWCDESRGRTRLPEDLYALGAVVYHLLTGSLPDSAPLLPVGKLRRNIPDGACRVIEELLDADPAQRPDARGAALRLEAALSSMTTQRTDGSRERKMRQSPSRPVRAFANLRLADSGFEIETAGEVGVARV